MRKISITTKDLKNLVKLQKKLQNFPKFDEEKFPNFLYLEKQISDIYPVNRYSFFSFEITKEKKQNNVNDINNNNITTETFTDNLNIFAGKESLKNLSMYNIDGLDYNIPCEFCKEGKIIYDIQLNLYICSSCGLKMEKHFFIEEYMRNLSQKEN